jgi:hypothetical protein
MPKKVTGLLDNFKSAQGAVKDLLGAGFECDSVGFRAARETHCAVVIANAENEIMADRAVVILRRHGAAEIDERPSPPSRGRLL